MDYQDKSLQCSDCGNEYTFSASEQELFHSKGHMNNPKRCPACRQTRKQRQASTNRDNGYSQSSAPRRMFPATCGQCGKTTEVPFEPRGDRPVYCSDCYRKIRTNK